MRTAASVLLLLASLAFPASCSDGDDAGGSGCTALEDVEDGEEICCESYGLGSEMKEFCYSYAVVPVQDCAVPDDWDGGGKRRWR